MTAETYTCACCHQTFTAERSDEEAVAECKREFGVTPDEIPCDVLCDECFHAFQEWLCAMQKRN